MKHNRTIPEGPDGTFYHYKKASRLHNRAVAPGAALSAGDPSLARLGIRPEDKTPTSLMFSNMFMSG